MAAMTPFEFFLLVVAVHRLTQLVGHDRITGKLFRWRLTRSLYRRSGHEVDDPKQWGDLEENPAKWDEQVDNDTDDGAAPELAVGLRCWWCLSLWSAIVLVTLRECAVRGWIADGWYTLTVYALAASTLTVLLAKIIDIAVNVSKRLAP